ncbi:MAG TPA: DEAD/DEAH box helicase [Gemmatimonadales bacterium]|nr:DEAD/DEAH box helicase [Gemmatimonadales bacterium]
MVARALAASLAPRRASDPAPDWLDEAQADAFRLLLAAVRTDGAVLCADPVGSGKTFVSLAVARGLGVDRPACLVPAALVPQWKEVADRLGIQAVVWSHAQLSRGRLPRATPSFVIVDESHHFRHPGIRRYRTLAPWLVGRRVLLLSATPIVNRSSDLFHQLHLGLRDDALGDDGAPSLRRAFARQDVPASLGRFVIQRLTAVTAPPTRYRSEVLESGGAALLDVLDRLALSSRPEIAALLRTVFCRALSSSTSALLASMRRYRHLLLHARDARAAGRPMDRRSLRLLVGDSDSQLVLWPLLPAAASDHELVLDDLDVVEALMAEAARFRDAPDPKSDRLADLLRDRIPTLVFVAARETITYLRRRLPDRWLAWCTGRRSGLGTHPLPRNDVLNWFRPDVFAPAGETPGRPRTLLTTDVAAEGLNLQGAGRVVHYDLPWTDVRLSQRDGRAVRRGSPWGEVEVVRFLPGPRVEARLRQLPLLRAKAALPVGHGLGEGGRSRWRWRRDIAGELTGAGVEGVAAADSDRSGVLAGLAFERDGARIASMVFHWEEASGWSAEPGPVERRLREGCSAGTLEPPPPAVVRQVLTSLAPCLRRALRDASTARISGVPQPAAAAQLGRRLRTLASEAARRRDEALLTSLERALRFCTCGHTAGEAMLLDRLALEDDQALLAALPGLPDPGPPTAALRPRLTGLIFFGRDTDWTACVGDPAGRCAPRARG